MELTANSRKSACAVWFRDLGESDSVDSVIANETVRDLKGIGYLL